MTTRQASRSRVEPGSVAPTRQTPRVASQPPADDRPQTWTSVEGCARKSDTDSKPIHVIVTINGNVVVGTGGREQGKKPLQKKRPGTNLETVNSGGRHLCEDRTLDAILDSVAGDDFRCSCERNTGGLTDVSAYSVFISVPRTLGACSVSHGKLLKTSRWSVRWRGPRRRKAKTYTQVGGHLVVNKLYLR